VRRHRPDVPVILCGCHSELRHDSATMAQLSKTGRSPVSIEQALAICCEIQAVNYIETSAKEGVNDEAFEVCAIAAMKRIHTFKRKAPCRNSPLLRRHHPRFPLPPPVYSNPHPSSEEAPARTPTLASLSLQKATEFETMTNQIHSSSNNITSSGLLITSIISVFIEEASRAQPPRCMIAVA
ncbi:Uncharacterized protein FKW44_003271, partial [Caligus rogercresseyi]